MAKSIQNVVMQGASGKIGKTLVFRQTKNGDTVIANRAKKSKKPIPPSQEAAMDKFTIAAYTARIFAKDAVLGPQYAEKGKKLNKTAYIVAMQDCLRPPMVRYIDHREYKGEVSNVILVRALDDFKVASVHLRIIAPDGTTIEQGAASLDDVGLHWIYVTTVANATLSGTKIEATAADIPGNQTLLVETIN